MLQIEHIYKFFKKHQFTHGFDLYNLPNGVVNEEKNYGILDLVLQHDHHSYKGHKILFYDQEPLIPRYSDHIIDLFRYPAPYSQEFIINNPGLYMEKYEVTNKPMTAEEIQVTLADPTLVYGKSNTLATSEISSTVDEYCSKFNFTKLYYFFHGFAALDWFRGYHALNYTKNSVKNYKYDYQSFNRIVTGDRAYRKTFVDQLRANDLLKYGAVSYGVTDDPVTGERLVIDHEQLPGSASADIPDVDAFWHIVTETVFYYPKLHLTEKIFKPIVSKQPFMLLAAPGNLEYLRSYGFKTFAGIIDESYDNIEDNDARIDAVVEQIKWYCDLTDSEKTEIQRKCEPIVEYNFHHFYGKFKEIITDELLDNTKKLFDEIGYDDANVDYATVRKLLTS